MGGGGAGSFLADSLKTFRDIVLPNHSLHVYTGSLRRGTDDGGLKYPAKDINYITYILCLGHKLNTIVLNYFGKTVFFYFYCHCFIALYSILLRQKVKFLDLI